MKTKIKEESILYQYVQRFYFMASTEREGNQLKVWKILEATDFDNDYMNE